MLNKVLGIWILLVIFTTLATAQSRLDEASALARKMGYSGKLVPMKNASGFERFGGQGMAVHLGGPVNGALAIIGTPEAPFNRGAKGASSEAAALSRARDFLSEYCPKLGLPEPEPDAITSVRGTKLADGPGWMVEIRHNHYGHRGMPVYYVYLSTDGTLASLDYLPLANEVPAEPSLTEEQAMQAALRLRGADMAQYTLDKSELMVGPDHKGGCALIWVLWLKPAVPAKPDLWSQVDAVSGEVFCVEGSLGAAPPAPPGSKAAHPNEARASSAPLVTAYYTLLAIAGVLLLFLVVKLRKK
jgi:hypothetical protein